MAGWLNLSLLPLIQITEAFLVHYSGNLPGSDPHATFARVLALMWHHWKTNPHSSDVLLNKPLPMLPVLQAGQGINRRYSPRQATARHQAPALAAGATGGLVDSRRQVAGPPAPAVLDRGIGRSRLQTDSSQATEGDLRPG